MSRGRKISSSVRGGMSSGGEYSPDCTSMPSAMSRQVSTRGYHPDPPNYGRIADGSTNRPRDYYREVARRFAAAGFVVVVPDYRGHNDSVGSEFVQSPLAAYWYTRDVIAAYRALPCLPFPGLTLNRLFSGAIPWVVRSPCGRFHCHQCGPDESRTAP